MARLNRYIESFPDSLPRISRRSGESCDPLCPRRPLYPVRISLHRSGNVPRSSDATARSGETTEWRSSRSGRLPGTRSARGRRGSRSGRARRRPRAARAGAGRLAAARGPRRRARDRRAATSPRGWSRLGGRRVAGGGGRGVRVPARRGRPARRGAPNTKHSDSEFDASRLAPCRPVQAHLADRVAGRRPRCGRRGR